MRTDLFDFDLPDRVHRAAAGEPARFRADAGGAAGRCLAGPPGCATCRSGCEPGDQLVVNDTKVISAQLTGRRIGRGDRTEDRGDADQAARRLALAGTGEAGEEACRRAMWCASAMRAGCACSAISTPQVEHKGEDGEITLSFSFHGPTLDQAIADLGTPPLPPYIASKRAPDERDAADYQTMFAVNEGAVAAPTAGLHFTPALEAALRAARRRAAPHHAACRCRHLPAGQGGRHRRAQACMPNGARLSRATADALNAARAKGGRIVAVGTTSLRLLESAAGGRRHDPAVLRRDRDLHHAGLPVSRGRYAADEFPSAALDAVHAGLGVQRSRDHAAGLCPRHRAAAIGSIPMATRACCFMISPPHDIGR